MGLLDFIFPKECILCSRIGTDICDSCIKTFAHTLPSCPICNKLSKEYITHLECSNNQIQFYTGWYLTKGLEYILLGKRDTHIYSLYLYLLRSLIQYLSIDEIVNTSNLLPILSIDKGDTELNSFLVKHIHNRNCIKKDILYIGWLQTSSNEYIEYMRRLPFGESSKVRFLILFKTTPQKE